MTPAPGSKRTVGLLRVLRLEVDVQPTPRCLELSLIGTARSKKIGVFQLSSPKVGPITPNTS
jgi:hypothetical protein